MVEVGSFPSRIVMSQSGFGITSQGSFQLRHCCRLGWETDSATEISLQEVYLGVLLGLTLVKGKGRKQDWAEGEALMPSQRMLWLIPWGPGGLAFTPPTDH